MARIRAYEETLKFFELKAHKTKINKKRRPYDIAIGALEKQIPVKCECINQVWGTFCEEIWRCPKCHTDAVRSGFYCWSCGQRLDWSGEDDK